MIAPRSNRSPRRALLALAFGLSLLLAWGLARDTEPEHPSAGTEWEDGRCEPCAPGSFTDEFGSSVCEPCPAGTFRAEGMSMCTQCVA